jgi:hypothetical protein
VSWTSRREPATQVWPAPPVKIAAVLAPIVALSRSASAKTMFGLLPPSSKARGFRPGAERSVMRRAVAVEPGERDLSHVGMAHDRVAGDLAEAGDDVDDAGREARRVEERRDREDRGRGLLGGLQHDRVARGEGRADLGSEDREGRVPGHDQADDTEGLVEREVEARLRDLDRLAVDLVGGARPVVHHLGDRGQVAGPGLRDRLAVVAALDRRELFGMLRDLARDGAQEARPAHRGQRAPGTPEGPLCRLDGGRDVVDVAGRDLDPGRAEGGIDARQVVARAGGDPTSVDPMVDSTVRQ